MEHLKDGRKDVSRNDCSVGIVSGMSKINKYTVSKIFVYNFVWTKLTDTCFHLRAIMTRSFLLIIKTSTHFWQETIWSSNIFHSAMLNSISIHGKSLGLRYICNSERLNQNIDDFDKFPVAIYRFISLFKIYHMSLLRVLKVQFCSVFHDALFLYRFFLLQFKFRLLQFSKLIWIPRSAGFTKITSIHVEGRRPRV